MKLKFVCAVAASLTLLAGSAFAESDAEKSQRYEKNTSNAAAQKVNKKEYLDQLKERNLKFSNNKRHPIHRARMGDH